MSYITLYKYFISFPSCVPIVWTRERGSGGWLVRTAWWGTS